MIKKLITAVVGILIFAVGGYFAYNYMTKQNRQKDLRAQAEAKQKDMKPLVKTTPLAQMNVGAMMNREAQKNSAAAGQPGAAQQQTPPPASGQPPQQQQQYNPAVGNTAAAGQMAPDFATQKVPASGPTSVASGDAPVTLEQILSGKTVLSISFSTLGDPTLSGDDRARVEAARLARLQAQQAQESAQLEAARQARLAEEARLRALAEEARDPSRAIRNKIKISGIVDKEVFIGSKAYGVGSTVLGARIVSVSGDTVTFSYKGQRFTKKVAMK